MNPFDSEIIKTFPKIITIDSSYIKYMHTFDNRVNIKKNRPYVALAIRINGKLYAVPLTSQTTQKRKDHGLKKRNSLTTTFIKASGIEISCLLHNNMIPVPENIASKIDVNSLKNSYIMNELRYIRKHWLEINRKSSIIYFERYNSDSKNFTFLQSICCDFKMLEKKEEEWLKRQIPNE